MKLDNPTLTAFALGELSPAEQAILEQEISIDREIAAEIDETKEIARILRAGLSAEPAERLAEHQRDAIFREARILSEEKLAMADSTSTPFTPVVVPRDTWWNRPGPWQAIAACAVAGFAAYALLVNVGKDPATAFAKNNGEIAVSVPTDNGSGTNQFSGPNLTSPNVGTSNSVLPAVAGSDVPIGDGPAPKFNGVNPTVKVDVPKTVPPGAGDSPEGIKGPHVINSGQDDWRSRADIGKRDKQIVITDAGVAAYLRDRLKEAGEVHEGTSYGDFLKTYRPSSGAGGKFEMIRTPQIKVDAIFDPGSVPNEGATPTPNSRLKSISKPYLE